MVYLSFTLQSILKLPSLNFYKIYLLITAHTNPRFIATVDCLVRYLITFSVSFYFFGFNPCNVLSLCTFKQRLRDFIDTGQVSVVNVNLITFTRLNKG